MRKEGRRGMSWNKLDLDLLSFDSFHVRHMNTIAVIDLGFSMTHSPIDILLQRAVYPGSRLLKANV